MGKRWKSEEFQLLKQNYPTMTIKQLVELFKRNGFERSEDSIENKATELKLKKKLLSDKEGYKYCKKCGKELPNTEIYFPVDRSCVNGLRNVCRECGKDGHFMKEGYVPKEIWGDEKIRQFTEIYPLYTNEELRKSIYPDLTDKQLFDRAWKCGISKNEETYWRGRKQQGIKTSIKLKGVPLSEEHKRKESETKKKLYAEGKLVSAWKGRIVSEEEKEKTRLRNAGKWKGKNNPRYINPLKAENNGRWQGGITNLSQCLRENNKEWKEQSMELCGCKCILTRDYFDNIHHLIPFRDIISEALCNLRLKVKSDLNEYSANIRTLIINEVNKLHQIYGLGVCVSKDIHKLFHDNYGYYKFSKTDFERFTKRYFDGEFDESLSEKHKSIYSTTNYEEVIYMIKNNNMKSTSSYTMNENGIM